MKKLLLPTMIAAGLFGLSACDDKPDTQTTQKAAEAVVKAAPAVDNATAAENAFKSITEASQTYYQTMLTSHPMIKSITYQQDSYTKGTDTSTAVTKGTVTLIMKLDGQDSFDLLFKHKIKHDAATIANGLVASIDSVIEKPADSTQEINQLIENFNYTTNIKADGAVHQDMVLKPLTHTDGDNKALFNGLNVTTNTTIKDIAGGFGRMVIDFKGAKFTDDGETFAVDPLNLTGEYKPSGEFNFKTTTPFIMGDSEVKIQASDIVGSGTMLFNKKYDIMLGKQKYQLKNVQITTPELPMPFTLESTDIDVATNIDDKDTLSASMNLNMVPSAGLSSMLSQGMLDISQAAISYEINNAPAALITEYQNMMKDIYGNIDEGPDSAVQAMDGMEARLKTMFEQAKAQGAGLNFGVNLTAAEGPANIDASAKMLANSTVTLADIQEMQSPAALFQLININANASVPAALLEKTGAQMMAGPFIQKNGDVYQSTVTTENGQLLINGIPAPL